MHPHVVDSTHMPRAQSTLLRYASGESIAGSRTHCNLPAGFVAGTGHSCSVGVGRCSRMEGLTGAVIHLWHSLQAECSARHGRTHCLCHLLPPCMTAAHLARE